MTKTVIHKSRMPPNVAPAKPIVIKLFFCKFILIKHRLGNLKKKSYFLLTTILVIFLVVGNSNGDTVAAQTETEVATAKLS